MQPLGQQPVPTAALVRALEQPCPLPCCRSIVEREFDIRRGTGRAMRIHVLLSSLDTLDAQLSLEVS